MGLGEGEGPASDEAGQGGIGRRARRGEDAVEVERGEGSVVCRVKRAIDTKEEAELVVPASVGNEHERDPLERKVGGPSVSGLLL